MHFIKRQLAQPGQWAVLAGACILIFCIFSVTAYQMHLERDRAFSSVISQNHSRVMIFQQYILRTLEMGDVATGRVASRLDAQIVPTPEAARRIIADSSLSRIALAEGTVAMLPSGEQLATGGLRLSRQSWDNLKEFVIRQRTAVAISPPFRADNGIQFVVLTRRLNAGHGPGFVGMIILPDRLTEFSRDVPFGRSELISLVGLDGITRARRSGSEVSTGENLSGKLVMRQQARFPYGTYYGPSSLDGEYRIFSHRRIARYDVFATSGTSLKAADSALEPRRFVQLAMMAAALASIVAAAALLISGIGRRQRQLTFLAAANSRLNEAQQITGSGDWDYLPATDELIWSDNLCVLYGRDRTQRVTRLSVIRAFIGEAELEKISFGLEAAIRTGEPQEWEILAKLRNGLQSHRRVSVVPIRNDEGEILRLHGVDQSIDQEFELVQLQEQLAAHARLHAMNALAATLAHEINQPLGVAANFIAAARRRLIADPNDGESFHFLEQAEEQIIAVADVIGATRQILSTKSSDRVRFSIAEAIDRAMVLLRGHPNERSVRVMVEVHANAAEAFGNAALTKQVIYNLLKNALEAIPDGRKGAITVTTAVASGGDSLYVSVTDNGDGFAEGIEPFNSLRTRKSLGLGLGLALSRTIIESVGGRIWVERTGNGGTTIRFSLPTPPAN